LDWPALVLTRARVRWFASLTADCEVRACASFKWSVNPPGKIVISDNLIEIKPNI
jgi:hypothetical protein